MAIDATITAAIEAATAKAAFQANYAWIATSMALVFFMTPGLAFFYAGLLHAKNVTAMMFQNFISLSIVTLCWFAYGWSMAIGGKDSMNGFTGDFSQAFMSGLKFYNANIFSTLPDMILCLYQLMFAIITPILMTGAFANRLRLWAWAAFLVLWMTICYFPLCHWFWGGGFLYVWGARDFAGGLVVHISAGMACLAMCMYLGPRATVGDAPHSLPLVAIGTAMLWFGWFGFNGGSTLSADTNSAQACVNTHFAAATAALVWVVLEQKVDGKKPSFVGYCTGAIAGLATITPHAGWVTSHVAVIVGVIAGVWCWGCVKVKEARGWDDALDVWAVHGMGGFIGTIMTGLFANKELGIKYGFDGSSDFIGLFEEGGSSTLLVKQIVAAFFVGIYCAVFAIVILFFLETVMGRDNVRVSEEEQLNLDKMLHDEKAYDTNSAQMPELSPRTAAANKMAAMGMGNTTPVLPVEENMEIGEVEKVVMGNN